MSYSGAISETGCPVFGFFYARLSMAIQQMNGFGIKDCLTKASLGSTCFGNITKIKNFKLLTLSIFEIFYVNQSKVVE